MGAGSVVFGPCLTVFPDHKKGAGCKVGLLGLGLVPIWDPGLCEATRLTCWVQQADI